MQKADGCMPARSHPFLGFQEDHHLTPEHPDESQQHRHTRSDHSYAQVQALGRVKLSHRQAVIYGQQVRAG